MTIIPMENSPAPPLTGPARLCSANLTLYDDPYAANTAMGDGYMTFRNAVRDPGGYGMLLHAELVLGSIPSAPVKSSLWLFTKPPIYQNNAEGFVKDENMLHSLISVIDMSALVASSAQVNKSGVDAIPMMVYGNPCCGINRCFKASISSLNPQDSTSIYGILVANDQVTFQPEKLAVVNLHIMA